MTAVLGVRVDRVRSCVHSGAPQDSSIGLLMEQGIDGPQLLYVLRDHAYPAPHCTCLLYSWIMDRHGAHDHAVQRVGVRRLREAGGRDRVHDAGPLSGRRRLTFRTLLCMMSMTPRTRQILVEEHFSRWGSSASLVLVSANPRAGSSAAGVAADAATTHDKACRTRHMRHLQKRYARLVT